jgi:hypothetical protein
VSDHDCTLCPYCNYCVTDAPHRDGCDPDARGTAPAPGSAPAATPVCPGIHIPERGAFLVVDGVVRPVTDHWPNLGPTYDGRIRWGVVTQHEGDRRE